MSTDIKRNPSIGFYARSLFGNNKAGEVSKTFQFGKVDANDSGKKQNLVELTITLKKTDKGYCFSASGDVWKANKSDIILCGQCIDSVWNEYGGQLDNRKLYMQIMDLWQRNHLNDLTAGSPRQESEVAKWRKANNNDSFAYDEICKHLEEKGLLADKSFIYKGEPFKYGSAWLITQINDADLLDIMILLTKNN